MGWSKMTGRNLDGAAAEWFLTWMLLGAWDTSLVNSLSFYLRPPRKSHRGTAASEVPSYDDRDRSSHGFHRQIPPGPSSFLAMDGHWSLHRLQNWLRCLALGTSHVGKKDENPTWNFHKFAGAWVNHVFFMFGVRISEHYSTKHQILVVENRWGDGLFADAMKNLEPFGQRAQLLRMPSSEAWETEGPLRGVLAQCENDGFTRIGKQYD